MKLTKQILATYIGAQVFAKTTSDEYVGEIHSLSHDRIATETKRAVPNLHIDWYYYDQCRLILTPLSAISEDDAVEVARIIGLEYNNNSDSSAYFDLDGPVQYLTEEVFNSDTFAHNHLNAIVVQRLVDYLRSRNYDLGYGEIKSLIEAGLAVDSTKLNNP